MQLDSLQRLPAGATLEGGASRHKQSLYEETTACWRPPSRAYREAGESPDLFTLYQAGLTSSRTLGAVDVWR